MKAVPTVQVVSFSGGLYDSDVGPVAVKVMRLSMTLTLIYVIMTIMDLADSTYRDAYVEFSLSEDNPNAQDLSADQLNTMFTISVLVGLCCVLAIPLCGYMGAKNDEPGLVQVFCCCSGCCAFCGWLGLLSALFAINGTGATCEFWEDQGLPVAKCYVRMVLSGVLALVFCLSTYYANELFQYQKNRPVVVYQTSPMATATPTVVTATPVEGSATV